ncbi:MAG: hypothetical protein BWY75_00430 [bacterium ADurb.Bin425]|nr:MAG: hypothetical protein BWY75_00430 [bacterium ADurb.Bin425]
MRTEQKKQKSRSKAVYQDFLQTRNLIFSRILISRRVLIYASWLALVCLACLGNCQKSDAFQIVSLESEIEADQLSNCLVHETFSVKQGASDRYFERIISCSGLRSSGFRIVSVKVEKRPAYFQLKQEGGQVILRVAFPSSGGDTHRSVSNLPVTFDIEYVLRHALLNSPQSSQFVYRLQPSKECTSFNNVAVSLHLPKALSQGLSFHQTEAFALSKNQPAEPTDSLVDKPIEKQKDSEYLQNRRLNDSELGGARFDRAPGKLVYSFSSLPHSSSATSLDEVQVLYILPPGFIKDPGILFRLGYFVLDWYPLFLLPLSTLFALLSFKKFGRKFGADQKSEPATIDGDSPLLQSYSLTGTVTKEMVLDELLYHLRLRKGISAPGSGKALHDSLLEKIGRSAQGTDLTRTALSSMNDDELIKLVDPAIDQEVLDLAERHALDAGLYISRPGSFIGAAYLVGGVLLVSGLLLTSSLTYMPLAPLGFGVSLSGLIMLFMARFMPDRTVLGESLRLRSLAKSGKSENS